MIDKIQFNSLLVPTDFSENSMAAFERALHLVDGEDAEIVVMHAIDPAMVAQLVLLGAVGYEQAMDSLKKNALEQLQKYQSATDNAVQIDKLVCEGDPFMEIIRKADDFAVDAIVMSKLGHRSQARALLFGSTAEKVVRASRKPVLVLPSL